MKNLLKATFVAVCCVTTPVLAAPLNPGGVVFPTGTDFLDPVHGGIQFVQNDNLIPFSFDPTPVTPFSNVGGAVQNRVTLNPANTLNFMPRIRDTYNIDGGTFAILAFSLDGFAGFDVDVDFRTDGLGDKGITSGSRSVSGDLMTFRFGDPLFVDSIIPPGRQQESLFPSLVTNAKRYKTDATMTIFGEILPLGANAPSGNADNLFSFEIQGLARPAVVPVPAAGVLLLAGVALLGGVAARRKRCAS